MAPFSRFIENFCPSAPIQLKAPASGVKKLTEDTTTEDTVVAETFVEDTVVAETFTESTIVAETFVEDTGPRLLNEDTPVPPFLIETVSEEVNSESDEGVTPSKSNLRGIASAIFIPLHLLTSLN